MWFSIAIDQRSRRTFTRYRARLIDTGKLEQSLYFPGQSTCSQSYEMYVPLARNTAELTHQLICLSPLTSLISMKGNIGRTTLPSTRACLQVTSTEFCAVVCRSRRPQTECPLDRVPHRAGRGRAPSHALRIAVVPQTTGQVVFQSHPHPEAVRSSASRAGLFTDS